VKKLLPILIVGIAIRILLSFSTFHPDSLAFKLGGELIASGKILNLYDYSDSNVAILNYPPAIYWFQGLFHFLFGSLLEGSLLVKFSYLIFDLLTGFLLLKLFSSKKEAIFAFTIWMFNPINLYTTYMMGQFDIIPTFFSILSIYLIAKNKLKLAAVSLGAGIAFKIYPIFLLIPLIFLGKNYLDKLKLFIIGVIPYLFSILVYLPSHSFRTTALFAAQSSKSLYAGIPVSGGESILLFPATLMIFYLLLLEKKMNGLSFWKIYSIPLLLFFIFTHFHPQWLIWITPFLIISLTSNIRKVVLPMLLIFTSWFLSLFFFDPSLTLGMFAPIFAPFQNAQSIWVYLHIFPDYNLSRSLIQSVFVSSSLYLVYEYFPRQIHE